MTNQTDQHLEDIQAIRRLMESSSRFLSLSGMSGIIAGVLGIAGALGAQLIITRISAPVDWYARPFAEGPDGIREFLPLVCIDGSGSDTGIFRCSFPFNPESPEKRYQSMDASHQEDAGKPSHPTRYRRIVHSSDSRNCSCRCHSSVNPDLLWTCPYQCREIHFRRDTLAGSA